MPRSFERVAVGLGLAGIACLSLGAWTKAQWLSWLGFSLGAPLLLGGLVALVVGLPMALIERARVEREKKREPDEDPRD